MSKITLSDHCESKFHGLWNLTSTVECRSCKGVNANLLIERILSAKYETVWPITGGWPCVASGTLQHPLAPMCCCGVLCEVALAKLFTEGFGSVRLLPHEDVNNVQLDLSLALTCLLTMAGKQIRNKLVEQRAPNCQLS